MNDRLGWLDFLRGLAVLGVAIVHSVQSFPLASSVLNEIAFLGRFGVQLFFVISGFIIFSLFQQKKYKSYFHFFIRRALRLLPLFWLFIVANLLINGFEKTYWAPFGVNTPVLLSSVFLLHSLLPSAISAIVPGGWSISVEFLFYIMAPFLVKVMRKRPAFVLTSSLLIHFSYVILKPFIHSCLLPFYVDASTTIVEDFLYLNFLNNAHFFILGMALAGPAKLRQLVLAMCTYMLAAFSAFISDLITTKELLFSFGPALLAMLMLTARKSLHGTNNISYRSICVIGKYSYGIYLVHTVILLICVTLVPNANTILAFIFVMLVSAILAKILERYDSRLRRWLIIKMEGTR